MRQDIRTLIERLAANNIPALYAETGEEAFDRIMAMIPEGSVVGFGD